MTCFILQESGDEILLEDNSGILSLEVCADVSTSCRLLQEDSGRIFLEDGSGTLILEVCDDLTVWHLQHGNNHMATNYPDAATTRGLNRKLIKWNWGGGDPPPPSYVGPLDLTTTPAIVAYGQRAMSAAKLGTALITIADGAGGATHVFNSDATTGASPDAAIQAYSVTPFVAGWTDQSGNDSHAVQLTAANQPQWTNAMQGGRPGFDFSATAGMVLATSGNITFSSAGITVFVVGAAGSKYFAGQGFETLDGGAGLSDGLLTWEDSSAASKLQFATNASEGATIALEEFASDNVSVAEIRFNGAVQTLTTPTFGFTGLAYPLAIGNDDSPGNSNANSVLEIIFFNALLSDADRTAIRQNIATYYGITLS